jgi:hypothetical protein
LLIDWSKTDLKTATMMLVTKRGGRLGPSTLIFQKATTSTKNKCMNGPNWTLGKLIDAAPQHSES